MPVKAKKKAVQSNISWTVDKVRAQLPHVKVDFGKGIVAVGVTGGRLNSFCTVWIYDYMNVGIDMRPPAHRLTYPWETIVASLNNNTPLKR